MERPSTLRRFFAGLAESTFQTQLGVADPPLTDYVAELMVRFVRSDAVYRVRDLAGRRMDDLADMLIEADHRIGEAKREVHRHVGDFALFWTGVYPEALERRGGKLKKDSLLNYTEQGKRAYYIASTIPADETAPRAEVLQRLSEQFELCAYGLQELRRELEARDDDSPQPFLLN